VAALGPDNVQPGSGVGPLGGLPGFEDVTP